MDAVPAEFVREAARYLREVHLGRLERAVAALPPGDLWWRPHEKALSVGNALLHLEGNVRQWLLSGLGGAPDRRDRASEFAATAGPDATALLARLRETVEAAAGCVERLSTEELEREWRIQGFRTTGLAAVLHVVEHFAWHTGQVVWIAKARAGPDHGISFYDEAAINRARND